MLTTLGSGAVLGYAVAPHKGKQTGETALFRQLVGHLKANDIVLGDAIFENYFLITLLQLGDIDAVFEKNGARHVDFRQCNQKLGKKDGLIRLEIPPRPDWMSREYYDQWVPDELMVRKEITVHLLVYNLIRTLMAQAATELKKQAREMSFKAAQETIQEFHVLLPQAEISLLPKLVKHMVQIVSEHIVGNRPCRSEPRAVKRRPKPHQRLQHSRAVARRLSMYQRGKA